MAAVTKPTTPHGFLSHAELPDYLARKRPRSVERAADEGRLGPIKVVKLGGLSYYLAADVKAYEDEQVAARHARTGEAAE